jgi:hypothetical protein
MRLLGDAREEATGGKEETTYSARLEGNVEPGTSPGEYRCVRLSARDRFDEDWEFAEAAWLDLVVRVERPPQRLEVTASDFL